MEEKRKFYRAKRPIVIYYRVEGEDSSLKASETQDISEGGMCFKASEPFAKDAVLAIRIQMPLSNAKIEVLGRVIESKSIGEGPACSTRVAFIDLDFTTIMKIKQEIV